MRENDRVGRRRRQVLAGGALIAGGALAGCARLESVFEDRNGNGPKQYADWLPAPDALLDADHYPFRRFVPAAVASVDDALPERSRREFRALRGAVDALPVDFGEADELLVVAAASRIVTGGYDAEDVEDALDDGGFDEEDDVGGYSLYVNPTESVAAGVSDRHLVLGERTGDEDAEDVVEAVVGAGTGDVDRYADRSDDLATLVDLLSDAPYVAGATHAPHDRTNAVRGEFEDAVGWGVTLDIERAGADAVWTVLFDDPTAAVPDAIERWASRTFDARTERVSEDGRAVRLRVRLDAASVRPYETLATQRIPAYLEWIPAPERVSAERLAVRYTDLGAIQGVLAESLDRSREDLPFEAFSVAASPYDFVDPTDERGFVQVVDPDVSQGAGTGVEEGVPFEVVLGTFTAPSVRRRLDDTALSRADYGAFSVYTSSSHAIAVGDGAVVVSSGRRESSDRLTGLVKAAVDAKTGAVRRYLASDPDVLDVATLLDTGQQTVVAPVVGADGESPVSAAKFRGTAVELRRTSSGFTVHVTAALLFPGSETVDLAAVGRTNPYEGLDGRFRKVGRAAVYDAEVQRESVEMESLFGLPTIGFRLCEFVRASVRERYGVC